MALIDPVKMAQLRNNLIESAIHYTPDGGQLVVITGIESSVPPFTAAGTATPWGVSSTVEIVASEDEAKQPAWATVTGSDTGMGISEEELPHIFERFFRGEQPRLMQISGSCLGLAIIKESAEIHGGRVTVNSQVGKGTTFTVWLPLVDTEPAHT